MIFPEVTVLEDLLDNRIFVDKRYYLHGTTAFWTFQRVHFKNALYKGCPGHAALATVGCVRFIKARQLLRLRDLLQVKPPLLVVTFGS